ncbi:MAG: histidine triad nucleotide-binding protein [Armatimonadota bacterium]
MADCIFCRIARGDIDAAEVYRDDEIVAFRDINPQAPVHMLVIPVAHLTGIAAADDDDIALLGKLLKVARDLAAEQGLDKRGYRLVINQGLEAGQSVDHIHVHLLGGRPMRWPPG